MIATNNKMVKLFLLLHKTAEEITGGLIAFALGHQALLMKPPSSIDWTDKVANLGFALLGAAIIHTIKIIHPNGLSRIIAAVKITRWNKQIKKEKRHAKKKTNP